MLLTDRLLTASLGPCVVLCGSLRNAIAIACAVDQNQLDGVTAALGVLKQRDIGPRPAPIEGTLSVNNALVLHQQVKLIPLNLFLAVTTVVGFRG